MRDFPIAYGLGNSFDFKGFVLWLVAWRHGYKTNGFRRRRVATLPTLSMPSAAARNLCTRDCLRCPLGEGSVKVPFRNPCRVLFEVLHGIASSPL